ncbi:hypothetical protein CMEL01_09579 [Colletotrichum melonis]|uniref:Uncharacterized protein n=1 Tax=Colletotrichum melonis TaxID=1209925 RepID=A0AAI9U101_9PEZI|nr:hypothetical protein CMEL01_09579 [Colletotrichum melonis]
MDTIVRVRGVRSNVQRVTHRFARESRLRRGQRGACACLMVLSWFMFGGAAAWQSRHPLTSLDSLKDLVDCGLYLLPPTTSFITYLLPEPPAAPGWRKHGVVHCLPAKLEVKPLGCGILPSILRECDPRREHPAGNRRAMSNQAEIALSWSRTRRACPTKNLAGVEGRIARVTR